jgi:hypothetical protein
MNRVSYEIQWRSLQSVLEHLRTLDLAGMAAAPHASTAEQALIAAVRAFLATLP